MKSRIAGFWMGILFVAMVGQAFSQVVVGTSATIASTATTQISFSGNFTNNSTTADFSNANLILTGDGQTLANSGASPTVLGGIIVDGGGTKTFTGIWEIAGSLTFNNGLVVTSGSNSMIVHTIPTNALSSVVVNNTDSYVSGTFFSRGTGTRVFPIGINSGYFPSQLYDVTQGDIEIGMRVVSGDAGLTNANDPEIVNIFNERYWQIIDRSNTLTGAKVGVSSLETSGFIQVGDAPSIVGAPSTGGPAINFGGGPASGDMISAGTAITNERIFTIGLVDPVSVEVVIHNIITPGWGDSEPVNDYLEIANIGSFPDNHVRLLDRYGIVVKEWKGYVDVVTTSSLDPSYDLTHLATGNYICVLEYKSGNSTKKFSQMVTIINP